MKKALIIYYSQTGQLKNILESITAPMKKEFEFSWLEIRTEPDFPFPWNGMPFFQPFPECVKEIPFDLTAEMESEMASYSEPFDLIILGVQVWYLSPSIPVTSLLKSKGIQKLMNDTPVITVQGVRNMWVMSQERVKKMIAHAGGKLIGNIVLADPHTNLVSVVTIVKWMMQGDKYGKGLYRKLFPPAGVPEDLINNASRFGDIITAHFRNGDQQGLQTALVESGAVPIKPVLVTVEKRGFAMFGIWSKFVLKKGGYNDPAREGRLNLFKYYLFTVIFLASPIGAVIIWFLQKLRAGATKKMIRQYQSV